MSGPLCPYHARRLRATSGRSRAFSQAYWIRLVETLKIERQRKSAGGCWQLGLGYFASFSSPKNFASAIGNTVYFSDSNLT